MSTINQIERKLAERKLLFQTQISNLNLYIFDQRSETTDLRNNL